MRRALAILASLALFCGVADAQVPLTGAGLGTPSGDGCVGPGSATTWNPADIGANITLSNGNLTATGTNATAKSGRATTSEASAKWYWEIKANPLDGLGIALSTATLASYLGFDTNGIGYFSSGGVTTGNTTITTIQTYTAGNTISVALDMDNKKIWFRVNGGNWNNSGAANPATNVGGISGLIGAVFPAVSPDGNGDIAIANFGASCFAFTPPAGFSNLP